MCMMLIRLVAEDQSHNQSMSGVIMPICLDALDASNDRL